MKKFGFIFSVLLLTLCRLPLLAQGTLTGRITLQDGQGVEFATVGVVGVAVPYGCVSDEGGRYTLYVKESDSVDVRINYSGAEPQTLHVRLVNGERRTLNVVLRSATTQLNEVVVKDDRIRSTTFTTIDVEHIENAVGPSAGVEALIKTLPDVSSGNELSSQYSVRGGSFDENLVYINGVEVYRPQLVRSGQQEGMSIINPDMVDHILFSSGGFDATYGDRLSSVLDIIYSRPVERKHNVSVSLLGCSASAQGVVKDRFTYSVGFRHHNNSYLFRKMDTEGSYTTAYTDLQGVFGYRVNDKLDLSLLAVWTHNNYGLVPFSRTTTFGSFNQYLELDVYFDGLERDLYNTLLGAVTLDYHPSNDFQLRWITSAQANKEQENYDLQSQYWLYQVGIGEQAGDTARTDYGVGTFLEHARNALNMGVYSTELKAVKYALLGNWNMGLKVQVEDISDRMREWKWVDSAGYSYPTDHPVVGINDTVVHNPVLQQSLVVDNRLANFRGIAYLQREVNLFTKKDDEIRIFAGIRTQYYQTIFRGTATASSRTKGMSQWLLSPRLSVNFLPKGQQDLLYRLTAGIYQQPTLYRELRRTDGTLCMDLPAQCSYQATGSVDWNLKIWDKPFRLTADIYYKYITNLVPYTIDNLRIRYNPDQEAVGYAAGVSLRINGQLLQDIESWASISLMQTQEDILGDDLGWLRRPTDQRFSFKVFFQDNMPEIPWWRMSLSLIYGSRIPTTHPNQTDRSNLFLIPPYYRVDWGNTIQLTRFEKIRQSKIGRFFSDLSVGLEVFNLFNYHNVVSFLWVSDYTDMYRAVPNYLTARQLNLKITGTF